MRPVGQKPYEATTADGASPHRTPFNRRQLHQTRMRLTAGWRGPTVDVAGGAGDAIQAVPILLWRGHTDVADADLSKYFYTIPHHKLRLSIARRIVDPGSSPITSLERPPPAA